LNKKNILFFVALSVLIISSSIASAEITVEVTTPNSATIINSSTSSIDINFNVSYDGNQSLNADIHLDEDTNAENGTTEKITTIPAINGANSFNWNVNASDGTHYIYVQVTDGNETGNDYSESFLIDKTPPETTATGFNDNEWNNTPITAFLSCNDSTSDCNKTYYKYKLNDANFNDYTEYSTGIDFNSDGIYLMKFYSTDNAGNTETEKTATIKIDSIKPADVNDLTATADQLTINLNWSASTDGNGSGIEKYYIYRSQDKNSYSLIGSSATTSYSDSGLDNNTTYFYYVIASDYADNNSNASNDANATAIDTEGPTVSSNADSEWHKETQKIELTCSDSDFDKLYYKINGTEYPATNANPKYVEIASEGENSLEFWATDVYGNEGPHTTVTIKIDNSAPNAPSLNSPTGNSNGEVSLSWSKPTDNPSSANSGLKGYKIYRKSSGNYEVIATITNPDTTTYTDTGRSEGTTYYYKVTAIDNLDNESDLSNSNEQKITMPSENVNTGDSIPPAVSWTSPKNNDILKDVNITLKAYISDAESPLVFISFTYKKEGGSYTSIGSFQENLLNGYHSVKWNTEGLENGTYQLKVLARDEPGNINSKVITVTLQKETETKDVNADSNQTEKELAEKYIQKAKENKTEAIDLINYWKEFNVDLSSDERIIQANSLLEKAENELKENKLNESIKDANEAKNLFEEFTSETEINIYKKEKTENKEINLSTKIAKENETLKESIKTERELQLIEIKYKGETYYQQNIVLKIENISDNTKKFKLIEVIPKEIIENANSIKSSHSFNVIEKDPIIEFELELEGGKKTEIVYSLNEKLTKEKIQEIIDSQKAKLFENPVLLKTKTKINKSSFKAQPTGFFLLENVLPIGITVTAIIALILIALFIKNKGIEFIGPKEEEIEGLASVYSKGIPRKRTPTKEKPSSKIKPLSPNEEGGRFAFRGND
jgi:fibronectin type 3 domain-containing protein